MSPCGVSAREEKTTVPAKAGRETAGVHRPHRLRGDEVPCASPVLIMLVLTVARAPECAEAGPQKRCARSTEVENPPTIVSS